MQVFKFKPILKTTLWGGDKIIPFKHLQSTQTQVGESWEISGVKDNETVVSEGPYAGKTLNELCKELGEDFMGKENYKRFGHEFPLLIKFIDARQDLSIQVHPNDDIARRKGLEHGKTEMWYIMDSENNAKLYCGLKKKITPETYKQLIENDSICDALAQYEVKEDDFDEEPPAEPKAKRGDIYLLGNHRLMCGDSTIFNDVEKLMNDALISPHFYMI